MAEISQSPELDAAGMADLLIRIGRLAYASPGQPALTPTQWMALRYFSRANRYSRTVSSFADYHATTRGTVSQTIKSLTEKGYLRRVRSESDGRSARIDLTDRGRELIQHDPISRLADALSSLPRFSESDLARYLAELVNELASTVNCARFGRCELCRFLWLAPQDSSSDTTPRCRVHDVALEPGDLKALCASFAPIPAR